MVKKSLRSQAAKGILWNTVQNFTLRGGQFAINIILARLLLPSDFGLIGMLAIFISLSQTLVTSGMSSAIIQKKNRTNLDYSTVFIFNFLVSSGIYLILFFASPLIANFYDVPQLTLLTRVLCLNIVINSLGIVQISRLTIKLDFKTLAKVNILAMLVGGIIAIILAYMGFGVWSLVSQSLVKVSVMVGLLFILGGWIPKMKFSKQSFRKLFGFGSKILLGGVIKNIFQNLYNVVIGKYYSAGILGFYTQGYLISQTTAGTVSTIIQKVTFPILSSKQDDKKRMVLIQRKMMGMLTFVLFPAMTLLALLSGSFVRFFLGEKWLPAIPLIQWLCFARIAAPIGTLNMNILNAAGRSDLYLKTNLIKLPLAIIALIITIPSGIEAVVIGQTVTAAFTFFIEAYLPGKLFGYGPWEQVKDMFPKIVAVAFMAVIAYFSMYAFHEHLLKIIVGGATGVMSYCIASLILKIEEIKEIKMFIHSYSLKY